jgi:hypothetical protein
MIMSHRAQKFSENFLTLLGVTRGTFVKHDDRCCMKRRYMLIVAGLLIVAIAYYASTGRARAERTVKRLLLNPDLQVETAEMIEGGREPVYAGIVRYDETKAASFCESLGLYELGPEYHNVLQSMAHVFEHNFSQATNTPVKIYAGTLKHAPFATQAVIEANRIYFVFSRY